MAPGDGASRAILEWSAHAPVSISLGEEIDASVYYKFVIIAAHFNGKEVLTVLAIFSQKGSSQSPFNTSKPT
jgi:hypothetical protein